MAHGPATKRLALFLRRELHLVRQRLDIATCKWKIEHLLGDEDLNELVEFALRERAISAQQVASELITFAQVIAHAKPHTIVEIGTSRGGTLFILCRLAPRAGTIISVDMPGGGFGEAYTPNHIELFRRFPVNGQTLHIVTADSHRAETRRHVQALLKGKDVDLLFIDGDHSYEGVRQDFDIYSPLVATSGLIALHDIAESTRFPDCQVKAFWDEVKEQRRHREIIANPGQGWAGIGLLWKEAKPSGFHALGGW